MLRGISEIRAFLRTNETPIHFISPTALNLLGTDRWLRNVFYINLFDCSSTLRVMKRINNRAAAVEAVLTRHGTVAGPLMTDLTGHPEQAPHKRGWCGDDIFPEALSPEHRDQRHRRRVRRHAAVPVSSGRGSATASRSSSPGPPTAPPAAGADPMAASSSGRWRLPPRAAATSPSSEDHSPRKLITCLTRV